MILMKTLSVRPLVSWAIGLNVFLSTLTSGRRVGTVSRLVVALPAFNEERTLSRVIGSIRKALSKESDFSIVVIDDGSTDRTSDVAASSGADFVVRHMKNLGVAQAYRTAIRAGLKLDADVICTIDADGQFHAEDIPRVVEPVRAGLADLVIGSRFIGSTMNNRVPTTNRVANRLMAFLVSMLIKEYLHDTESGFRAISRRAAEKLQLLGVVSFSSDMILDVSRRGFRIAEVPVRVTYYQDRVSKVVTSFVKYGFKSLCLIVMKLLSSRHSFDALTNHQPEVEILGAARRRDSEPIRVTTHTKGTLEGRDGGATDDRMMCRNVQDRKG